MIKINSAAVSLLVRQHQLFQSIRAPTNSSRDTADEPISMVQAFRVARAGGPSAMSKDIADERRLSTLADVATGVSVFIVNDPCFHNIN